MSLSIVSPQKAALLGLIVISQWPRFTVFNDRSDAPSDEKIEGLRDELIDIDTEINNIQAAADAETRELTAEEIEKMENLFARFQAVEEDIDRRETILQNRQRIQQSMGRRTEPQRTDGQGDDEFDAVGDPNAVNNRAQTAANNRQNQRRRTPARPSNPEDRNRWGFRNFGEFAMAVVPASAKSNPTVDPRLIANAPTTYGQEGVGEDGGFLVPPDFREQIMKKVAGVDSLLSRTDQQRTSKNMMVFPKDEDTPWSSNGIQVYWDDEADQISQSKPRLKSDMIRANRLTCLVPITDELMEDAAGIGSYLEGKVPDKFNYKLQNAIVSGTGAGQFTGILSSKALVTAAKDTSTSPNQPADTVRYRNITAMWNQMYAPCRRNAVWLINQDVEEELDHMEFKVGSNTAVPVYLPPGGASSDSYARLKGRPVIPVESCPALGDKGDIILADLSQYMTVMKTGGIRQDVSIHLYFDYVMTAFRFIFRIGGKPWWDSSITLPNSTKDRSCFVTLAERA